MTSKIPENFVFDFVVSRGSDDDDDDSSAVFFVDSATGELFGDDLGSLFFAKRAAQDVGCVFVFGGGGDGARAASRPTVDLFEPRNVNWEELDCAGIVLSGRRCDFTFTASIFSPKRRWRSSSVKFPNCTTSSASFSIAFNRALLVCGSFSPQICSFLSVRA